MASQGAEYENQIRAWMKAFESLPEDRQTALRAWFGMQKVIIDNSGLSTKDWFEHVQWAFDHPLDFSFVNDFPAEGASVHGGDASEATDATRDAKEFVGATAKSTAVADGPGLQEKAQSEKAVDKELFDRFMHERMKPGTGK